MNPTVAAVLFARATGQATPRRRMPRAHYPHLLEVEYAKLLRSQVNAARAALHARWREVTNGSPADATAAIEDARREYAAGVPAFVQRLPALGVRVVDHQARQLDAQTRAVLGVPAAALGVVMHATIPAALMRVDARGAKVHPTLDDRLVGWVGENVSLIKSLGDTPLAQVEQLVSRSFAAGERHETLAQQIVERFGVAEDRARVIARDQIGKLNGRVSADRHQKMGLTRFTWRDVGDGRVRPAHRHLNNTIWSYDAPPREGLPGQPIQCRCHDEPIFDDILAELDDLEPAPPPKAKRRKAK